MNKAIIYFSDKSTLELIEGDFLIPIVYNNTGDETASSIGEYIELWNHVSYGLIPSIMDVFSKCDFFYLNRNSNIVYNSKSVVKIELL